MLLRAEQEWAPPDHPVFDLVPPVFEEFILSVYAMADQPEVNFDDFWQIYKHLLSIAEEHVHFHPEVQAVLLEHGAVHDGGEDQEIPLVHHERVAGYGKEDIPPAILIQDEIGEGEIQRELWSTFCPCIYLSVCDAPSCASE